jgi:hypothetical protein
VLRRFSRAWSISRHPQVLDLKIMNFDDMPQTLEVGRSNMLSTMLTSPTVARKQALSPKAPKADEFEALGMRNSSLRPPSREET